MSAEEKFRRNLLALLETWGRPGHGARIRRLADATAMCPRRMSRIVHGTVKPRLTDVAAIARAFEVDPGDLAFGRLDLRTVDAVKDAS